MCGWSDHINFWENEMGYIFLTYETIDIIGIDSMEAKEEERKKHALLKNLESGISTLFTAILYPVGHVVA
jgi:hypothetical protein